MNKMKQTEFILSLNNRPCYGCPNRQFNKMNHFVYFVHFVTGKVKEGVQNDSFWSPLSFWPPSQYILQWFILIPYITLQETKWTKWFILTPYITLQETKWTKLFILYPLYHFTKDKMNKIKKMIHFDHSVTSMSTINIP